MSKLQRQRGVALIVVMMIVALVVIIAANMGGRLQMQLQRQINLQERQQLLWLALGAEDFGRRLLKKSLQGQDTVHQGQAWAQQGAQFPLGNALLTGEVHDLQACFNLNALRTRQTQTGGGANVGDGAEKVPDGQKKPEPNPATATRSKNGKTGQWSPAQAAFQRVLEQQAPDLSVPAEYVVARIADWLDSDTQLQHAGGAEENDYAALPHPYYNANSLMVSVSELRAILDITAADYQLVAPLVCVIPQSDLLRLNVNTLNEEQANLVAGMVPNLDEEAVRRAIAARPDKGFETVDDFFAQTGGAAPEEDVKALFDVKSSYFSAEFQLETAESSFVLTTVYKVDQNANAVVISRRFGGPG